MESERDRAKRWRPWQFSLRTLLTLMLAVACFLDSSGMTKVVWDEERYLLETNDSDETEAIYANVPSPYGQVISQHRKTGATWDASYFHTDAIGSTRALTDETQQVTDTYVYYAWGEEVSRSGATISPFQWIGAVGYYRDPSTRLYYVRRRVLAPENARWLSRDPLESSAFAMGVSYLLITASLGVTIISVFPVRLHSSWRAKGRHGRRSRRTSGRN